MSRERRAINCSLYFNMHVQISVYTLVNAGIQELNTSKTAKIIKDDSAPKFSSTLTVHCTCPCHVTYRQGVRNGHKF